MSGTYPRIINQIPPHDVYVEPFAGAAAIAKRIERARETHLIDIDGEVVERLREAFAEEPSVQVHHTDAFVWLRGFRPVKGEQVFIYLDPPYLNETRSSQSIYRHEMADDASHRRLLELASRLRAMVAISGYPSPTYELVLADWRRVTWKAVTRGGSLRDEVLWCNYPQPQELHDYRYLGEGYRQREVIKRRIQRWRRRLAAMTPLERYAMLAALRPDGPARDGER